MRLLIATVLCLLSTHVFAEQAFLRCRGYPLRIADSSKPPLTFIVTIDRDRRLVLTIDADAGEGPAGILSNGSGLVETILFSETMISASQRLWPAIDVSEAKRYAEQRLWPPPSEERIFSINLVTGQFDIKISNGGLKYAKGTCAAVL
jgi:hypothetical protein